MAPPVSSDPDLAALQAGGPAEPAESPACQPCDFIDPGTTPTIFISHSTDTLGQDDPCFKMRKVLKEALEEKGWNVFLDTEVMQPGDPWRAKILHNLATARACIILLNGKACCSTWVRSEALIMCFRKSINPALPVVPVVFPDGKIDDIFLKTHEPFQFNEIQRLTLKFETGGSLEDVAKSIAALPELQAGMSAPPKCSAWVQDVADILAVLKPRILQRTVPPLRLNVAEAALSNEAAQSLRFGWAMANLLHEEKANLLHEEKANLLHGEKAHLLHQQKANICSQTFTKLISALSKEQAGKLGRYLIMNWVMNQSVETLLHALQRPDTHGWLVLNTHQSDVAQHYHARASVEALSMGLIVKTISITASTDDLEDADSLVVLVDDALWRELTRSGRRGLTFDPQSQNDQQSLKDAAQNYAQSQRVLVCQLTAKFNRAPVVSALRQRYPHLVFFVLDETAPAQLHAEAHQLLPPLVDASLDALDQLKDDCETLIKNNFP